MKVSILGASGQLGTALQLCAPAHTHIRAFTHQELDISKAENLSAIEPCDVVINASAYTAVDQAESNISAAIAVNTIGPALLADHCEHIGARLLHISTDYVFGPNQPQRPLTPEDATGLPESVYGRSKLAGELALRGRSGISIMRTAWVYSGNLLPDHRDFLSTMIRLATADPAQEITVVNDQFGSPTYVVDLARALWQLVAEDNTPELLHLVGSGQCSWWELAREIFQAIGANPDRVRPISTAEYPTAAPRPAWSVLASSRALPEWRNGVFRAVAGTL